METIQSLRKKGFKIRVIHFRSIGSSRALVPEKEVRTKIGFIHDSENAYALHATGGKTHVEVTSPEGKNADAEALCSNSDTFNRRLGGLIALGRALKQLNEK